MQNYKIILDNRNLKAFLIINVDNPQEEVSLNRILDYLKNAGIVYGLDKDAVVGLIAKKRWGENVLVAQGKEPQKGEDGKIEFLFDTVPRRTPQLKEDGGIDFHSLNLTQNVNKGQILARIIPPSSGETGINVLGDIIPGLTGKTVKVFPGENTSFQDEAKTTIQANVDGHVKLVGKDKIIVDTVFTVKGDVDYDYGDIDVIGDVKIFGDVKATFKVKATGNIQIEGLVEDAFIEAGGNVAIKGGFIGKGKGLVKAGGDVFLNFINGQRVSAAGNLSVSEEVVQSQITVEGAVFMTAGKGILIGGMTRAGKFIEVNQLGNDQCVDTVLMTGDTSKLEVQIKYVKNEISQHDSSFKEIKKTIAKLLELKYQSGWNSEQEKIYREIEKQLVELPKITQEMIAKLEELEKEVLLVKKNAYIRINNIIYPGVKIKIAGFPRKIESEIAGVVYRVLNNKVEEESII